MVNQQQLLQQAVVAAIEAGKATLNYWDNKVEVVYKADESPLTQADIASNEIIRKHLEVFSFPILSEESTIRPHDERKNWETLWIVDPLDGTKEFIAGRAEYTINIALVEEDIPVLGVVYAPALQLLYFATCELGSFYIEGDTEIMECIQKLPGKAIKLPLNVQRTTLKVVASKSHLSDETKAYIEKLKENAGSEIEICNYGSSLKLCRVADGSADIYPRLGPTMEWDTAAAHAIVLYAEGQVRAYPGYGKIHYNKENLLNPFFVVWRKSAEAFLP